MHGNVPRAAFGHIGSGGSTSHRTQTGRRTMSEHANRMEAEEPDTNRETNVKQFGAASLDLYLRDINRHPLLSREEEAEVARRIRAGDRAALDLLVAANLRFVVTIAK